MLCSENVAKVFEYLLEHSKISNPVVVNQREIGDATGVNQPIVSIAINKFKDCGLIRVKKGAHHSAKAEFLVNRNFKIIDRVKILTKWRFEIVSIEEID